jgi:hypothetical protein
MGGGGTTIHSQQLQRLDAYWRSKAGDGGLPARADIDPLELGFIIGNLILVEVASREPLRFRIRLHGTNLARRAGYELTGKMLDELPITEFRTLASQSFTAVVTSGKPFHSSRDRILDGKRRRYETLMLPLFDDEGRVNLLLVGLIYL